MDVASIIRRVLKNAAIIFGGRLVFGLLNLLSSAIVVRVYGLDTLGVVVLLQAYLRLFSEAIKFESWQAILTFGAGAFETDHPRFQRLIGLTLGVDIVSIGIGIAVGLALLPWAANIFEWSPGVMTFAPWFLLSLPFITQGTPNGVLRLISRIDVFAWQHAINAVVRFVGVGLTILLGGGVLGLVLAWFMGSVLSGAYQWLSVFRELYRRGLPPVFRLNLWHAAGEFPGLIRFLTYSNLRTSLSVVYNAGSTLLTGGVLGPGAAATLQIAQQLVNAIGKPMRQLGPIIAPEFAILANAGDWLTFRALLLRQITISAAVCAGAGVVLFIFLGPFLSMTYGEEILKDIWLFRILLLNALCSVVFFAFVPAMLSAAKAGTLFFLNVLAAAVYLVVVMLFIGSHGVIAVGYGTIAAMVVSYPLNIIIGGRLLTKRVRRHKSRIEPGEGHDPLIDK